jgi:hypothetical protein
VRDVEESLAAAEGGADIIDIKEPRRGSLGRASDGTIQEISRALRDDAGYGGPISAALGELTELPSPVGVSPFWPSLRWVKAGLSDCRERDWLSAWRRLDEAVSSLSDCRLIAVVYVDWQTCGAPAMDDVLAAALTTNTPGVLFDTCRKDGRTLLDYVSLSELADILRQLRSVGKFAALAGGINRQQLPELAALGPDIVAVRTAACVGGRQGRVDSGRVAELRSKLASARRLVATDEL